MPTRKLLVPLLSVILPFCLAPPAAANFDQLPGEPFDAASSTPYASAAAVTKVSPVFNTAAFGEDSGELNNPTIFLGCGRWGARTAWVRFATRVAGRVNISVDSSIPGPTGHDVFFKAYSARAVSSDYSLLGQTSPGATPCNGGRVGIPDEQGGPFVFSVPRGESRVLYVQVLSTCAERTLLPPCTAEERAAAPGGPTQVTMTYTPDDADRDNIADSLDSCPKPTDPCNLDSDGDGIKNDVDQCPFQKNPCAVDADRDGFDKNALPGKPEDCNDNDKFVNTGQREIRGNRKDDDCDGIALPYLRVKNKLTVALGGRNGRANHFTTLAVRNAPRGLRVVVECSGRGCPGPREYTVEKAKRKLNIRRGLGPVPPAALRTERPLGLVRLAPGARVTVLLLRKGRVGRVEIFSFGKGRIPKTSIRCTLPGSRKVRRLAACRPQGDDAAATSRR